MISIPGCCQADVEVILKCPPMGEWLKEVHTVIVEIIRHMLKPRGGDDRTIERVQQVSMHIARHAKKIGWKCDGEIVNATWSDEYFTIKIPMNNAGLTGTIRMEREKGELIVHLAFPHPVEFMATLGFSALQSRRLNYQGLDMSLKHVAFLAWCEHMKPGLSAPFLDMINDGEL